MQPTVGLIKCVELNISEIYISAINQLLCSIHSASTCTCSNYGSISAMLLVRKQNGEDTNETTGKLAVMVKLTTERNYRTSGRRATEQTTGNFIAFYACLCLLRAATTSSIA